MRHKTPSDDMMRDAMQIAAALAAEPLVCATCGTPLDGDSDEDPTGDAGLPICGECMRNNHFEVLDSLDGDLDDQLP